MNWEEYEDVTKYIYETLGHKKGVKIVGHGKDCKVKGTSGVFHQIDVLISYNDGDNDYLIAIECKHWKKTVNKDVVMKLVCVIEDARIHKGVVVSQKGFTKDARLFAKYKNIDLTVLSELDEKDQKKEAQEPSFEIGTLIVMNKVERSRPEILSITFDPRKPELSSLPPHLLILRQKDGKDTPLNHYIATFKKQLHKLEAEKILQEYYDLKEGHLINKATKEIVPIRGFTLKGKLTVKNISGNRQIDIVDEVWMKMKVLFEGKSYTISKTGMIKEDRK
ncbi:MAG: restriction endonuclease [Bacteroidia bacterium]|nr:restriction endonuclease [Bacteroidia bacterium]